MLEFAGARFAVALEMVMQLALQDIGQLTDLNRVRARAVVTPGELAAPVTSPTSGARMARR
jgi:hypothetical protein